MRLKFSLIYFCLWVFTCSSQEINQQNSGENEQNSLLRRARFSFKGKKELLAPNNENENQDNKPSEDQGQVDANSQYQFKTSKYSPQIVSRYDFDLLAYGVRRGRLGLQGDTGRRGRLGPMGIKGDRGVSGFDAIPDPTIKGPKGYSGLVGDNGDRGDIGDVGPKGEMGDEGPPGPKGKKGRNGLERVDGLKGPKGEKGPKGIPGSKGKTGIDGKVGPKGYKGDAGPKGPLGPPGPQGPPGKKGNRGGNPSLPPKTFLKNLTSTIIVEELTRLLSPDQDFLEEKNSTTSNKTFFDESSPPEIEGNDIDEDELDDLDYKLEVAVNQCKIGESGCPSGCAAMLNGLASKIFKSMAKGQSDEFELEEMFREKLVAKAKECKVQWR